MERCAPVDAIFGSMGFLFDSFLGFSEYICGVGVCWKDVNSDDSLSNIVGRVLMSDLYGLAAFVLGDVFGDLYR